MLEQDGAADDVGPALRLKGKAALGQVDRRELEEVTAQEQLHPPKGRPIVPHPLRDPVELVEELARHHADFVDHQNIVIPPPLLAVLVAHDPGGHFGYRSLRRAHPGEAVDGNATDVAGGDARGGRDGNLARFAFVVLDGVAFVFQESDDGR